jgi:predicted MFS family arabinose efflux permease
MSFAGLLRREPRALAFGVLHTLGATIGQTFVIALFLPGIKESFALRDGSISVMFTGTTLASAALLWQIGPRLDRNDLLRYSLACGAFLAAACALIAASRDIVLLVFGLFCLRLAGNGLLTHVALTATARCFTADRGRALSVVLLGSSVGEAALPAPVVAMLTAWGWRPTLVCAGCLGLLLVLAAGCGVRTHSGFRHPRPDLPYRAGGPSRHIGEAPAAPLRRYWVLTAPLFVAMPASITGAVFHQALIAEWKG